MTRLPIFVVHQHSARTQHFDLRLEIGGVKRDAEAAAAGQPVLSRPESVLSGRTIEQLAAEAGWSSTRR
jgi:hypothetical protein